MKVCIKCQVEHDGKFGSGKFCSRKCSNSRIFSDESKRKKSLANKGRISPNKGKRTKWITSKCLYCGKDIEHLQCTPRKYHAECALKTSGGFRQGSGRGKSGWYKGYWCDSSYELVWIIYQLDHNLPFDRNKKMYDYIWEGKNRKYLPDFIQDGNIIEIKGFSTEQTKAKLKSVHNLKILFRKDLDAEFNYVKSVYGKQFINMYEGSPYNDKHNKCKICQEPTSKIYCSRKCSGIGNNRNSKLRN